ncbi:unnamed protein product, partial [Ascophyllum nodosum]
MSTQGLGIHELLRLETELEELPFSIERNAKVNLLKYLQVDTVQKYERLSTGLYFDLRRDEGFDQLYRIHEKQGPKDGLEQPLETGFIEDYLRQAERAKLCLDQLLGLVSPPGTPGQEVVLASVKSLESTRRKVKDWGGIRSVTDLARATVICDTPRDLANVFEKLNLEIDQGSDILRVSNGFVYDYRRNGYRDVKVYVIVAEHICEIQLHLRSFYCLKDGQHEVYKWSRTLNVTAGMRPEHLFKNVESGTLQLMIRLAREDWRSTRRALSPLLHESGDYEGTRHLLRQEITRCEKLQAEHTHGTKEWIGAALNLARLLCNLAVVRGEQGKYAEADRLFLRAVEIWEIALGPEHPNVATALNNRAALLNEQCKYDEAKPLYERSQAIRKKALGPDHPDGKYAEAEPLYQRATEISEKALGPDHSNVALVLKNWAVLLESQ